MKSLRSLLFYFLILIYLCGSVGMVLQPAFFLPFTPLSLLLTSFVYLLHQPFTEKSFFNAFIGVALLGFASEWIGVQTGAIFGEYQYGASLGPKIDGVPVLISLNWALLVSAGVQFAGRILIHPVFTPLLASTFITALDFLIEQSATPLGYWFFEGGMAGIHNYLGWFLVSCLASFLFQKPLLKGQSKIAILILLLQVLFFGTIFIFNRLPL